MIAEEREQRIERATDVVMDFCLGFAENLRRMLDYSHVAEGLRLTWYERNG
ncbi:hypothetical protein ACFQS6_14380 [Xanthomonas populi]|uniref:hypothetical protein n=1 Tax=Xanthomonas populi TaxID=53414 RepID=UPI001304E640|nr:hypothetical protein [Xanthomonas populi]